MGSTHTFVCARKLFKFVKLLLLYASPSTKVDTQHPDRT